VGALASWTSVSVFDAVLALPAASWTAAAAMLATIVTLDEVGVSLNVYVAPLPAKLLSVAPLTVTSLAVKPVTASLNVAVTVFVAALPGDGDDGGRVTVGAPASWTTVTVPEARWPLPAASCAAGPA